MLHVDAASHPDLFWALRGGGGNFGVATSFTYRLHPLQTVIGGLIAHPIDAAPELLRFYRDAVADASDDLTVFAGLVHAPDGSGAKLAALVVFHTGDPDQAERELEPFKTWGSPLVVEVGPMPYPVMNTILDAGFPEGALNYWLSSFTRGLPDELIEIAVERFATVPSPMTSILFEHLPRRGDARRGNRNGSAPPRARLELAHPLRLDGSGRERGEHGLEPRDIRGDAAAFRERARGSTTWATTRLTTRSAQPTAQTTTGSQRSSAATTRTTSSTSITTLRPSPAGRGE